MFSFYRIGLFNSLFVILLLLEHPLYMFKTVFCLYKLDLYFLPNIIQMYSAHKPSL